MNLYKVYFTIEVYCNGVVSYANAHISVLANSEEEAVNKIKENVSLKYNQTTKVDILEI